MGVVRASGRIALHVGVWQSIEQEMERKKRDTSIHPRQRCSKVEEINVEVRVVLLLMGFGKEE
jgi:hypothetical protein